VNRKDDELSHEAEVLKRNVLAAIAKRYGIHHDEDRKIFMETGQTSVWVASVGRYRFFVSGSSDMNAIDAWLDVKKGMELKTPRGRHGAMMRLASKFKVF
jgi:hypothetical protein